MNRNDKIREIKNNLKRLFTFTDDQKFNNFTLTDGTNITTSAADIEVGAEVYMLDEQGNQTPLDNGDYVLNDGRTFTIQDNVVTEVKGPEEDGTDVESGDSDTDSVETSKQNMDANGLPEGHDKPADGEVPADDSQVDGDLAQRVSDLEKQLAEVLNILNKIGDSQNDINEQMMSAQKSLRQIGGEPGDKPVKSVKRGYEVYNKEIATSRKKGENTSDLIDFMKKNKSQF